MFYKVTAATPSKTTLTPVISLCAADDLPLGVDVGVDEVGVDEVGTDTGVTGC